MENQGIMSDWWVYSARSPSDMVFIICRKHISRLRVSAWSSLSKREPKPIRDCGLANCTERIRIMLGMCNCTVIILSIVSTTHVSPHLFTSVHLLAVAVAVAGVGLNADEGASGISVVSRRYSEWGKHWKKDKTCLKGCLPVQVTSVREVSFSMQFVCLFVWLWAGMHKTT